MHSAQEEKMGRYEDAAMREGEFPGVVIAICSNLPGHWKPKESYNHYWTAAGPAGMEISFSLDAYKGRFTCAPKPPRLGSTCTLRDWGVVAYGVSGPSAGFSMFRPPETLAKSIIRQIVKPYEEMFPAVQKAHHDRKCQIASQQRVYEELCALAGEEPDEKCDFSNGSAGVIYLRGSGAGPLYVHSATSIRCERLDGMTYKQAIEFIELVKSWQT